MDKPTTVDDGTPAFPTLFEDENPVGTYMGLTLRDYFAAQLKPSFPLIDTEAAKLVGRKMPSEALGQLAWSMELSAKLRYMLADALMAERERRRGPVEGK